MLESGPEKQKSSDEAQSEALLRSLFPRLQHFAAQDAHKIDWDAFVAATKELADSELGSELVNNIRLIQGVMENIRLEQIQMRPDQRFKEQQEGLRETYFEEFKKLVKEYETLMTGAF